MDERMRFVIRFKDGETMAALCREFGISRKTGYKIFERYEQFGLEGLSDRVRRRFRYANQLPEQVEAAIVSAKREKPHWGARKIRERLLRRLPHAIKTPAASTIHAVLDRHGLVKPMGRRHSRAEGTPLSDGLHPNDLWCTDYKGEFQLSDRRYCYPLTVTDYCSRYLLLCEALESNREDLAFPAFERLFRERGLPRAIRTDNGVPFASPHGLFQLSKLSVWWLWLNGGAGQRAGARAAAQQSDAIPDLVPPPVRVRSLIAIAATRGSDPLLFSTHCQIAADLRVKHKIHRRPEQVGPSARSWSGQRTSERIPTVESR